MQRVLLVAASVLVAVALVVAFGSDVAAGTLVAGALAGGGGGAGADSTKLPLTGGTMTGQVVFDGTSSDIACDVATGSSEPFTVCPASGQVAAVIATAAASAGEDIASFGVSDADNTMYRCRFMNADVNDGMFSGYLRCTSNETAAGYSLGISSVVDDGSDTGTSPAINVNAFECTDGYAAGCGTLDVRPTFGIYNYTTLQAYWEFDNDFVNNGSITAAVTAAASATETWATMSTSDSATSTLTFFNGTTSNNTVVPTIRGISNSTTSTHAGLILQGRAISTADDPTYFGAVHILGYESDDTALESRPLFSIGDYGGTSQLSVGRHAKAIVRYTPESAALGNTTYCDDANDVGSTYVRQVGTTRTCFCLCEQTGASTWAWRTDTAGCTAATEC